jgi:hypothetical protein
MRLVLNLLALVVWALVSDCVSGAPSPLECTKPAVRKEWRALTKAEKVNWISAVKARLPI